jgi:hypothetical protein
MVATDRYSGYGFQDTVPARKIFPSGISVAYVLILSPERDIDHADGRHTATKEKTYAD